MINNFHRGFDVIREQGFDVINDEIFLIQEQTLNEGMLNSKQIKNSPK